MLQTSIQLCTPITRTPRVLQVEGLFDLPRTEESRLSWDVRLPLDERPWHRAPAARFLRELEDYLSESEAQRVLDTVINWGRHAEIFSYDSDTEVLSLENF